LVSHRHITVNGEVISVSSYSVRPGDKIGVRERSKALEVIQNSAGRRNSQYPWLEWNAETLTGIFVAYPERTAIPENIKEQLIVELYSK